MDKYFRRASVDMKAYSPSANDPKTYYGLPQNVEFCRNCVISNQRPNSATEFTHTKESRKATIHFDKDGVCDACRVAEQKHGTIDWDERERKLHELCDRFRRSDGHYDCLVPGSGGKDSFYAAHILKHKYGMHPLTVTWAPHIYTEWGWKNFQSWIHAGFDNFLNTPNGRTHRLLTRLAVENLFHPFQAFMLGQKNLAPKMALLHNLPLVFYGENEAEYGNPQADTTSANRDWSYFTARDKSTIHLGGVSVHDLINKFGVPEVDLVPYFPADPAQIEEKKVEVHYLGYYLKWHPQSCYYYAVEHGGFQASPERTPGTYSKYNSIDDRIDDFHYYTTYIKFGIGRATYDAAQEIRSQDITREEGVALVKRFDGEFPERFAEEIFRYLSIPEKEFPEASKLFEQPIMDREYFMHLADRFRSPHIWKQEDGVWKLRHTAFERTPVGADYMR
ncbi:MAG: N-acetyl sugar amidotransferase [Xanthobacteraceae bacterium]|nr:N-acetyl sugar amidotransferase [Xanthobacteraceae bacterium]